MSVLDEKDQKEKDLLVLVNELIASLPSPPHSLVMCMEVGKGHGTHDLYLSDASGNPLHFFKRGTSKIWNHFHQWREPTQNAPDNWNLAVMRWSAGDGISVEYGRTDVENVRGFPARRAAWQKQEFGDREIPFFVEERKKRPLDSAAENVK